MWCPFCGIGKSETEKFRDVTQTGDHVLQQACWRRIYAMREKAAEEGEEAFPEHLLPPTYSYLAFIQSDWEGCVFRNRAMRTFEHKMQPG